jgi:hypothetical protein
MAELCQLTCGAVVQFVLATEAVNWRLAPTKTSAEGGDTLTLGTTQAGGSVEPPDEHAVVVATSTGSAMRVRSHGRSIRIPSGRMGSSLSTTRPLLRAQIPPELVHGQEGAIRNRRSNQPELTVSTGGNSIGPVTGGLILDTRSHVLDSSSSRQRTAEAIGSMRFRGPFLCPTKSTTTGFPE